MFPSDNSCNIEIELSKHQENTLAKYEINICNIKEHVLEHQGAEEKIPVATSKLCFMQHPLKNSCNISQNHTTTYRGADVGSSSSRQIDRGDHHKIPPQHRPMLHAACVRFFQHHSLKTCRHGHPFVIRIYANTRSRTVLLAY